MAQVPGIYVEIKGDFSQLAKDVKAAKQIVTESAYGMSNAINNALSPSQTTKGTNELIKSLGQLSRSSKVTANDFKLIGTDLKELQHITGTTGAQFQALQSRMMATQGAKAQEAALRSIAVAANLTEQEIKQLGAQFGLTNAQIKNVSTVAQQAATGMSSLGGAVRTALAYLSPLIIYEAGKAILDTGIKVDSLQRSFVALTGSTAGMESEFNFMASTAAATGQNMYALADSYRQLTASTQGTILEGQKTRDVFQAMSEASAVLGLSNEKVELSMKAFAQMAAKGVVQMEELKNQLGDSLPGAVTIAARAMGVTQAALMKMSAAGELLAEDLLPKMAAELHKMYGAAANTAALESGIAAVNRLSQEWTTFKNNLYDNKAAVASINAVTGALEAMNGVLDPVESRISTIKRELANMPSPSTSMLGTGETGFSGGGDTSASKRREELSRELGELQSHKEAKLAIAGEYEVGREKIIADSTARIIEIRTAEDNANKAHKDQEYQAYADIAEKEAKTRQETYEATQKASGETIKTQEKEVQAYSAAAEEKKRLSEEVTDALAKEGMTQTQQAKYELDKQYAADLALAGNDIALAQKVTALYQAELAKRTKSDNDWAAFSAKQHLAAAERIKDGWQVAGEGRAEAEEIANKRIEESTTQTTSVVTEEWNRAFESIQGAIATMIYEFDFSMDSIVDIFKKMLAEMVAAILMSGLKAAFLEAFGFTSTGSIFSAFTSGISGALGGSSGGIGASGAAGAAGWGTVGGAVALGAGAYGLYAGAKDISEGNTGVGAVEMGLGGVSAYKGAVALGLLKEGVATEVAKTALAKMGLSTAGKIAGSGLTTGYSAGSGATAYGTFQTAASGSTAAASGSSGAATAGASTIGVAAAFAPILAGAFLRLTRGSLPHADSSIDEAGIDAIHLAVAGFNREFKSIEDTILDGLPGFAAWQEAAYDANEATLTLTTGMQASVLQFDAATGSWSEMAVKASGSLETMGQAHTAVSSQMVSNTANMIAATTGMNVSLSTAATIANHAAMAFDETASSENGAAGATMSLALKMIELGVDASTSSGLLTSLITSVGEFGSAASSTAGQIFGAVSGMKSAFSEMSDIKSSFASAGSHVAPVSDEAYRNNPDLYYHAVGGIFPAATQIGSHVFGEKGAEALLPLPDGPDTMKKIMNRLDKIESKTPIVQVYIGNEQFYGKMRIVADEVSDKRQSSGVTGRAYI